jgi:hypothetical protein
MDTHDTHDEVRDLMEALASRDTFDERTGTPLYVRVYLKHLERLRAAEEGNPDPDYSEEEYHYLYQEDLLDASGEGTVGEYRAAAGWRTGGAQTTLDAWQSRAKQRVEMVKELGEEWRDVYNKDLVDEAQEEGLSIVVDLPEDEQEERNVDD